MKAETGKIKVAVLMGGIGAEREVSLQSGENIAIAVRQAGLDVAIADITPDNLGILDDSGIDVFFLGLHGEFGEDGQIQEILEERKLVFTGSDSRACRLAFDKVASKEVFREVGVTVPRDVTVDGASGADMLAKQIAALGEKYVIKPIRQGSSVGITITDDESGAAEAALKCFERFGDCMVEEFIEGREITVGIVGGGTLPIIEIRSKQEFYDYHAKYIDDATEFLFDTVGDEETVTRIDQAATACFDAIGCRHYGRVDMILADDGTVYVLEINTLPGMTSHSLLPKAAGKAGMTNSELCVKIIAAAVDTFER